MNAKRNLYLLLGIGFLTTVLTIAGCSGEGTSSGGGEQTELSSGGGEETELSRLGTTPKVLSPNGGERFKPGQTITIRWNKRGLGKKEKIRVELLKGGSVYKVIKKKVKARTGKIKWTVPKDKKRRKSPVGGDFQIRLVHLGTGISDVSDGYFGINAPASSGGGSSGGGGSTEDYKLVHRLNASANPDNLAYHWPTRNIKFLNVHAEDQATFLSWAKSWPGFSFSFGTGSSGGILWKGVVNAPSYCGFVDPYYFTSGEMAKCDFYLTFDAWDPNLCFAVDQTFKHELGHCLGSLHTNGGLMSSTSNSSYDNSEPSRMFNTLYSLPPYTTVSSDGELGTFPATRTKSLIKGPRLYVTHEEMQAYGANLKRGVPH